MKIKTPRAFPKFNPLFLLLGLALFVGNIAHCETIYAAEAQSTSMTQIVAKLRKMETELNNLEKSQADVLTLQDQNIEEIKNLKVWVNKHRGGKN